MTLGSFYECFKYLGQVRQWKNNRQKKIFWSLYLRNCQFGPCYFQFGVNLVLTINSLTKNSYVAYDVHSWHTPSIRRVILESTYFAETENFLLKVL